MKLALRGSATARSYSQVAGSDADPPRRRHGLTLVEMLVSMAITLMMLFAIMRIFELMGDGVNAGRATIALSSQLRQATHLLQQDLDGLTVPTLPWAYEDGAPGYFEYIEYIFVDGQTAQYDTEGSIGPKQATTSDVDDILIFTSRRKGKPFAATVNSTLVESPAAEIVWFCHPRTPTNPDPESLVTTNLYRLVVPVRPETGQNRIDGTPGRSLQELTRREYRFLHTPNTDGTIHELAVDSLSNYAKPENLVMANVLSVDVRAYHPGAAEKQVKNMPLAPKDDGYTGSVFRNGAYIDLGCGTSTDITSPPNFQDPHDDSLSQLMHRTWDTWPFYYERDGLDQDGVNGVDQGTNGINNGGWNTSVDDPGERETAPPYPYALRGIQVRIRAMEPDSRQIRQVSLVADFVPG